MCRDIYCQKYIINMSSLDVSNTNSKYCVYGCNTQIYWNTLNSEYSEVLTKKKHFCPNRSTNYIKSIDSAAFNNNTSSKPTYYKNNPQNNYSNKKNYNYKKSWLNSSNKPQMDNSVEILQGSTNTVTKQYELLTDLIKQFKGKTHGSQSHNLPNNALQIVVYYEVPEGKRDDIKRKFKTYMKNEIEVPH
jgi:signal peptidase I